MKKFFHSLITGQHKGLIYSITRPLFLVAEFIYLCGIETIKFLYRRGFLKSSKLKAKVISIGNITWGGTGKTSLVALLSKFLSLKNIKSAVLIRGYGGDEDSMLREQLGNILVLSGRNRIKNAKEAEDKYNCQALILDDGLQHWRIKRDLDIVAVSATNPFGNGRLIPAGILREPFSALGRADIFVLTKVNLANEKHIADTEKTIRSIKPQAQIFKAEHKAISITKINGNEKLDLSYITGKKICAVSGIGDNDSFFKMLLTSGAKITTKLPFPDHHKYTRGDISYIINAAKKTGAGTIITTAKDWVRLKPIFHNKYSGDIEILLLNITIRIIDEEGFFNRVNSIFNS